MPVPRVEDGLLPCPPFSGANLRVCHVERTAKALALQAESTPSSQSSFLHTDMGEKKDLQGQAEQLLVGL